MSDRETRLPNFESLLEREEIAKTNLAELAQEKDVLKERMREVDAKVRGAEASLHKLWPELQGELKDAPEVYQASYFLDCADKDDLANLQTMHRRGAFLTQLNDLVSAEEVPIVVFGKEKSMISGNGSGYRQGEAPKHPLTTFYGLLAVSNGAINYEKSRKRDPESGEVTLTPKAVTLPVKAAVQVSSVVGGWSYAYGEETWLESAKVTNQEHQKKVELLGDSRNTLHFKRGPLYYLSPDSEADNEVESYTNRGRSIYIGAAAIGLLLREVQSISGNHDGLWVNEFSEQVQKYNVD